MELLLLAAGMVSVLLTLFGLAAMIDSSIAILHFVGLVLMVLILVAAAVVIITMVIGNAADRDRT